MIKVAVKIMTSLKRGRENFQVQLIAKHLETSPSTPIPLGNV